MRSDLRRVCAPSAECALIGVFRSRIARPHACRMLGRTHDLGVLSSLLYMYIYIYIQVCVCHIYIYISIYTYCVYAYVHVYARLTGPLSPA